MYLWAQFMCRHVSMNTHCNMLHHLHPCCQQAVTENDICSSLQDGKTPTHPRMHVSAHSSQYEVNTRKSRHWASTWRVVRTSPVHKLWLHSYSYYSNISISFTPLVKPFEGHSEDRVMDRKPEQGVTKDIESVSNIHDTWKYIRHHEPFK